MMDPFKKPYKKQPQIIADSPIEQIKGIGTSIVRSATEDLVVGVAKNVVEQVFGPTAKTSLSQTQEVKKTQEEAIRQDERQRVELFKRQSETPVFNYREIEIAREIERIQVEIKRIIATSKEVELAVKDITVTPLPEKPGEYHLSFFQWVLKIIKEARMKVEESATWLHLFISKKKQRNFWAMFKKHGTQFGLSNERVVAMQTG